MSLDTLNNGDSGLEARTKINAAIASINSLVGGGSVSSSGRAFVDADAGDDAAAAPGDMARPYATLQAAWDAGARRFSIVGSVGDLNLGNYSGEASFFGVSRLTSSIGTISGSGADGSDLRLFGNGRSLIHVSAISITTVAASTNPNPGAAGYTGFAARPLYVSGMHFGTCTTTSGTGGLGGMGGNGGAGGPGGLIDLTDCFLGSVFANGGNGANGSDGASADEGVGGSAGSGGDSGMGGTVNMRNTIMASPAGEVSVPPGTPGDPGNPGYGPDGFGITGSPGATQAYGNIDMMFCEVSGVSSTSTRTVRGCSLDGTFTAS